MGGGKDGHVGVRLAQRYVADDMGKKKRKREEGPISATTSEWAEGEQGGERGSGRKRLASHSLATTNEKGEGKKKGKKIMVGKPAILSHVNDAHHSSKDSRRRREGEKEKEVSQSYYALQYRLSMPFAGRIKNG